MFIVTLLYCTPLIFYTFISFHFTHIPVAIYTCNITLHLPTKITKKKKGMFHIHAITFQSHFTLQDTHGISPKEPLVYKAIPPNVFIHGTRCSVAFHAISNINQSHASFINYLLQQCIHITV